MNRTERFTWKPDDIELKQGDETEEAEEEEEDNEEANPADRHVKVWDVSAKDSDA